MIRLSAFAMKDNPLDSSGERGCIINTSAVSAFEGENDGGGKDDDEQKEDASTLQQALVFKVRMMVMEVIFVVVVMIVVAMMKIMGRKGMHHHFSSLLLKVMMMIVVVLMMKMMGRGCFVNISAVFLSTTEFTILSRTISLQGWMSDGVCPPFLSR